MWKITKHDPTFFELTFAFESGMLDADVWRLYKSQIMEILHAAQEPTYILSDFSAVQRAAPDITKEFGDAPHLAHPMLAMVILMSEAQSPFHKFWLKVMELKSTLSPKQSKIRADMSRTRALERVAAARAAITNTLPE